jgi:hypothetical protein
MAPNSKRKAELSPSQSPVGHHVIEKAHVTDIFQVKVNSHKRRQPAHSVVYQSSPSAVQSAPDQVPFIDRVPRPTRWRKAVSDSKTISLHYHD